MLYIAVLVALLGPGGGEVSCPAACARCRVPPVTELAAAYCSLCRECRARRRDWLEPAGPPRRHMAPVHQPNYYREEAYYNRAAWNAPNHPVSSCPSPPPCDDGGQFAYVKVYGLKTTACPPAPPCGTATQAIPHSRRTLPPVLASSPPSAQFCCANQCCPMFMPMLPYSCMCSFGAFGSAVGVHGSGAVGSGTFGPGSDAFGPGLGVTSQHASSSHTTASTEPVYLYIGIPKEMSNLVD